MKHTPATSTLIAGVSILFAVVMAVVAVVSLLADDAWTPLGPFPVQQVKGTGKFDSPVQGDNIIYPAVHLADSEVKVTGTKCYKQPVAVEGSVSWASTVPPGLSLLVGEGQGDRDKGCQTSSYVNQIPPLVAAWAVARFAEGEDFVLVRISGREIAYRKNGEASVPLTWRTEIFAILPDESG